MNIVKLKKRLDYYNGLIRCPVCEKYLSLNDDIKMNIIATLTHINCPDPIRIKDTGKYKEILAKYPDYFPGEE